MQRTISSESPACAKEGWLFRTSLPNWANVIKNVSTSTVKRRLYEAGLHGWIAIKKSLLSNQNYFKNFQWTKAHKHWTTEQWNKVLWTDESNFEIFGTNMRVYVLRRVGERAATPCIRPTVKYGRGSVEEKGFCQFRSREFTPGKGQIQSDRPSQHTAPSRDSIWNAACGSRICNHAS